MSTLLEDSVENGSDDEEQGFLHGQRECMRRGLKKRSLSSTGKSPVLHPPKKMSLSTASVEDVQSVVEKSMTSIQDSSDNVGFMKKIKKRIAKGMVMNRNQLFDCIDNSICWGSSSIHVQRDKSRESSAHTLNIEEVRDLLISVNTDTAPSSKFFEVQNKSLIRHVVFVHFKRYSGGRESDLWEEFRPKPVVVRVAKHQARPSPLPQQLLTMPMDEAPKLENVKKPSNLLDYILPSGLMALYNYPILCADGTDFIDICTSSDVVDGENDDKVETENEKEKQYGNDDDELAVGGGVEEEKGVIVTEEEIGPNESADASQPKLPRKLAIPKALRFTIGDDSKGGAGVLIGSVPPAATALATLSSLPTNTVRIPKVGLIAGFVCTNEVGPLLASTTVESILAIDCEMCNTTHGKELTRLSVLNGAGDVVLDTLVLPRGEITEYLTQFSGISADVMLGVTVTFEQAQLAFLQLCGPETILIGHSLENDLKVMYLCHAKCVDTSHIYPHPKGFPLRRKLQLIAKEYAGMSIQQQQTAGHDSIEDARAALNLALKKVSEGPNYGVPRGARARESVLGVIARVRGQGMDEKELKATQSLAHFVVDCDYDARGMAGSLGGGAVLIPCKGAQLALNTAVKTLSETIADPVTSRAFPSFLYLGLTCNDDEKDKKDGIAVEKEKDDHKKTELVAKNEMVDRDEGCCAAVALQTIKDTLQAANSNVLLIVSSQRSLQHGNALMKQRYVCSTPGAVSVWSSAQEEELKSEIKLSNLAQIGFTVIQGSSSQKPEGQEKEIQ